MNIPTKKDWKSEPWDLDIPYAYKHFYNKTIEQGIRLFEENAIRYQEDIMFMPKKCFNYYVHAYMDYLLSEQSKDDSDGASCFFGLVEIREQDFIADPAVKEKAISLMKHMQSRQEWYDADVEIYGNFKEKAAAIIEVLNDS